MSLQQATLLILIVPPILFLVIAAIFRPPWRMIGIALLAGLVVGGVNILGDAIAHDLNLWRYPFTTGRVAPLYLYLNSVIFYGAGIIGLFGWWIRQRFGWSGAVLFLIVFPILALARDIGGSAVADSSQSLIVWSKGVAPYVADFILWVVMACAGFFTVYWIEKAIDKNR